MQLQLGGALHALALPFAKLAFWRKPAADNASPEAPPMEAPAAEETGDAPPVPKPGLLARFRALFRRQPKTGLAEDASADTAPAEATETTDATEEPATKPGWLARFKALFRRRAPDGETEESTEADTTAPAEGAEDAPAPRGLLHKLRSKWVWIPALALLLLGVIGTVAAVLVRSANETARLQQELQATKQKLQQQQHAPAVVSVAPPAKPTSTEPASPPEPKRDPAFDIVGVKPAPEAESGINAGDCVVSDREQVAANLKRCIDSFNAAVSTPSKKKKP